MRLADLRNNMRQILIEVSGLDPRKVYWANQNMPKVKTPLMTLQLYGFQKVASEELRNTCQEGTYDIVTPTEAILTVQYFDKPGQFATDFLENLLQQLARPTVVDACQSAGFSFFDADPVIDVTELLGNGQEWEPRGSLDLHVRYAGTAIDSPGTIEGVHMEGTMRHDKGTEYQTAFSVPDGID